jgi:hypothetical protein
MKNLIWIALVAYAILLSSCEPNCADGNGVIITQTRDVSDFTGVESNGDFEVNIYPGEESGVEVEAAENLMSLIITRVSGSELIIEPRRGNCIRSSEHIRVTVTVPDLNHIDLNGSGIVWCDTLATQNLEVDLDGSGTIRCISLMVPALDIDLSGSGKIETEGTFTTVNTTIDGSGDVILYGESQTADFLIRSGANPQPANCLPEHIMQTSADPEPFIMGKRSS